MIWIAHRGLYNGPSPATENSPMQIRQALDLGYEVEIDVRWVGGKFYLGHDSAQYDIHDMFLQNTRLWCHAKTIETLLKLMSNGCTKVLTHDKDDCAIAFDSGNTDKWIWTYPDSKHPLTNRSIAVMPENTAWTKEQLEVCAGICSDYVAEYQKDLGWKKPAEQAAQ